MSRQAGLTLVELVITLVVAAILATIAVPSFRAHVQNTRVATLTNDVVALVHDARSEAITRGAPVVVCASPDGIDCHGSWKDGWMPGGALPSNVIDDLSFAFLPNGFLNGAAATFHLCIDGVSAGRQLTIQASGQLVVEALDC
jgi:type IV fimbrial biogenesis protein FimT